MELVYPTGVEGVEAAAADTGYQGIDMGALAGSNGS